MVFHNAEIDRLVAMLLGVIILISPFNQIFQFRIIDDVENIIIIIVVTSTTNRL